MVLHYFSKILVIIGGLVTDAFSEIFNDDGGLSNLNHILIALFPKVKKSISSY